VNKLKEKNVIRNFIADIDYSKIGYELTTVIGIRAKGGKLQDIERKIADEKTVSAVYDVTGEYDAMIVAKFKDRKALNQLVKKLTAMEDVERTNTMVVLNVIKEAHGITLDE
jgi:Lrp/AsnC family transcriptional regulator for asnA, asnC and gidA